MGVYDFNTSSYNIDEIIRQLKHELQSIVINSQTSITEIKKRISEDEVLLNRLKTEVDNLPNFDEKYNQLQEEIRVLSLALDNIKAHPILLDSIEVSEEGRIKEEVQKINDQFIYAEHAVKDISGRDIVDTYATKEELSQSESDIHNTISAVSAWAHDAVSAEYDERKEADDILQNAISAESARAIEEESLIKSLLISATDEFDEDLNTLYEALEAESANRASEDALLRQNIDTEVSARVNAENELWDALNDEETARIDAVSALHDEFAVSAQNLEQKITDEQTRAETAETYLQTALSNEITRALQSESNLGTKIENEISRSTNKDTVLEQKITTEQNRAETAESNLQEALSTETTRASTAENTLQSNIDSEIERATGIESGLRTDLDNEISRATESETTIQTTLQENIDNEVTRATNAENSLQSNIDSEATLRESTDNTIQINLSNEITRATGVEDGLRSDLTAEITRATGVENTLTTNLNDEISNRETADRDLQAQIDTIEATQNIVDIVGSYAELEVYDTTHLKNNDKIQVLQDEIVGGSTIYTWNKDESKWDFIGEFGPYYTTSETNDLLNTKQNNLSAGDGIDITNDVVSHSVKIIENNNTEDIVEGTVFTVYLKNNHYKIITFDKTITEIKFMIEQSPEGILQETGFEFAVPEDSDLETLSFNVIGDANKKIYTIIPDSYMSPNIYQGTIVNYRCTIGEYEVED